MLAALRKCGAGTAIGLVAAYALVLQILLTAALGAQVDVARMAGGTASFVICHNGTGDGPTDHAPASADDCCSHCLLSGAGAPVGVPPISAAAIDRVIDSGRMYFAAIRARGPAPRPLYFSERYRGPPLAT